MENHKSEESNRNFVERPCVDRENVIRFGQRALEVVSQGVHKDADAELRAGLTYHGISCRRGGRDTPQGRKIQKKTQQSSNAVPKYEFSGHDCRI